MLGLTANHRVRSKLGEFVIELLGKSGYILVFRLTFFLEALCVCGGNVMEVFVVQNGLVGTASCRVGGNAEGAKRVAVVREVTSNELGTLWLSGVLKVLQGNVYINVMIAVTSSLDTVPAVRVLAQLP